MEGLAVSCCVEYFADARDRLSESIAPREFPVAVHYGERILSGAHESDPHFDLQAERSWYAILTTPRHEKSVENRLKVCEVESYLPTYECVKVWKNRQRVSLLMPLFPSYLFVRICTRERG